MTTFPTTRAASRSIARKYNIPPWYINPNIKRTRLERLRWWFRV